ncbi:ATP-dependent RNA helicase RhlE [Methyloligella halotolerans]|uniref:DEAD-box ATP-dependent RNA helicase RhpA n=1 Tax=Methyloligella halotolerans TaxID=1177755 RepID=A0A1E2S2Z7_9HYPH|nr:DEAD/DEAH box helicase [Methyloligella halotolerans]ODA68814.1 ATP-dependent RNA helicase RhlE [Methyloligella halotolerans]
MSFADLGLSPKVLSAVQAAGYETATPIQAQAIPYAMMGRDVLGIAQTGTGKTASFVLPMLTKLEQGRARARMPRSLILEPTRELAAQVADEIEVLGKQHKLTVALLIGGVSYDEQDKKLDRGADIVIATPGRLLDHFQRGKLLLNGIQVLVVDEADRMLDMGFIPDIEKICKRLPFTRQTLFFSATMPAEIQRLVNNFLHQPARVEVAQRSSAATTIKQRLAKAPVEAKGKREVLRELMRAENVKNAIIFCNRKKDVGIVLRSLQRHGFNAGGLHGDMDQRTRTATLEGFRDGSITFLAASDVAARGLDIPAVSHVFNYDVPIHPEDYVHRIGRTGRAGREGFAATLVTPKEIKAIKAIEKMMDQEIPWLDGEGLSENEVEEAGSDDKGGRRRGRGGRSRGGAKKSAGGGSDRAPEKAVEAKSEAPVSESAKPADDKPAQKSVDDQPNDKAAKSAEKDDKPKKGRGSSDKSSSDRRSSDKSSSRPEKSAKSDKGGRNDKSNKNDKKKGDNEKVRGMGDHVPAFMMRSVRPS